MPVLVRPRSFHAAEQAVDCTANGGHSLCGSDSYCDSDGKCSICEWCGKNLDPFDSVCPKSCGVTVMSHALLLRPPASMAVIARVILSSCMCAVRRWLFDCKDVCGCVVVCAR